MLDVNLLQQMTTKILKSKLSQNSKLLDIRYTPTTESN